MKRRALSVLLVALSLALLLAGAAGANEPQPLLQVTTHAGTDEQPGIARAADGRLWVVWRSYRSGNWDIWYKTSADDGVTWSADTQLTSYAGTDTDPAIAAAGDGLIRVVWARAVSSNFDIYYKISPDGGASWTADAPLTTDAGSDSDPTVLAAGAGRILVAWTSNRSGNWDIWYKSKDNAGAWSFDSRLTSAADNDYAPNLARQADGTLWLVWLRERASSRDLLFRKSADNGATWTAEAVLPVSVPFNAQCPSLAEAGDGRLWLAWSTMWTTMSDDSSVWYATSTDHGATWSTPAQFTHYPGRDEQTSLAALPGGQMAIAWQSARRQNFDIWLGIPGQRDDIYPFPYVWNAEHRPAPFPDGDDTITFRARAQDDWSLAQVTLEWILNGTAQTAMPMYDDGAHGDDAAGDGLYAAQHAPLPLGSHVVYRARATDGDGNTSVSSYHVLDVLEVPAAPTNVAATDGTLIDKVQITWNAVDLASSYTVYRSTSSNPSSAPYIGVVAAPSTSFDDTDAQHDVTYYYWVAANNLAGSSAFSAGDSGWVARIRIIPPTPVRPPRPTLVRPITPVP